MLPDSASPFRPLPATRLRHACSAAVLSIALTTGASSAAAQSTTGQLEDVWRSIGVGVTVGSDQPLDDDVEGGPTIGVNVALTPRRGWGPSLSFGWYDADLGPADAVTTAFDPIGELRVRPLLAGVGYTWLRGPWATTASMDVGIAFNSADLDDDFAASVGAAGGGYALDASNSFAARPAVKVEYAVTPKFAVRGTFRVLFTNPDVTLVTPTGRFTDRWEGNSLNVSAGVVYYPFQ